MKTMCYIGPIEVLKGKMAQIQEDKAPGYIQAQFDDLTLPYEYTHGWKIYPVNYFEDV